VQYYYCFKHQHHKFMSGSQLYLDTEANCITMLPVSIMNEVYYMEQFK